MSKIAKLIDNNLSLLLSERINQNKIVWCSGNIKYQVSLIRELDCQISITEDQIKFSQHEVTSHVVFHVKSSPVAQEIVWCVMGTVIITCWL